MNDNEVITFEDRTYLNPEVSLTEQDEFIEKFKNIQGRNQAQIAQDTYNLGTPVTSNQGGLTGAEGLWNAQYTRPAVNAAIENLRQINAQQAVNTAMQNQQNAMANRLNQAKRAYYQAQQRAYNNRSGSGTSTGSGDDSTKGNISVSSLEEGTGVGTLQSNAPGTSTVLTPAGVLGISDNGRPDAGVYATEGGQPLWSTGEQANTVTKNDVSMWEINNPLAWLAGLFSLAGTQQQVKQ